MKTTELIFLPKVVKDMFHCVCRKTKICQYLPVVQNGLVTWLQKLLILMMMWVNVLMIVTA